MSTKTQYFTYNKNRPDGTVSKDKIIVIITDNENEFSWAMSVNGEMSQVSRDYDLIISFKGYYLATEYWKGTFPVLTPFNINTSSQD